LPLISGRPPGRPKGGPPTDPAGVHVRPVGSRTRRPLVWFFDLDNTLHDASHAIFRAIDSRMTAYVERHLQVDPIEADCASCSVSSRSDSHSRGCMPVRW